MSQSTFKKAGVRLKANKLVMLGYASTPTATDELSVYFKDDGYAYRWNGTSEARLDSTGGGGGGVGGFDTVYSVGENSITLDEGPITLTDPTTGALNSLVLVKSGAGSGNLLDMAVNAALTGNAIDIDMNLGIAAKAIYIDCGAGARTGSDIDVKDDSTGAHSVFNIEKSGSGASVGFDYQESYNGSSASFGAKFTLDNADGIDTTAIQIVRGTGLRTVPAIDINDASTGSGDLIDVDLTGIFTGDVFSFATSAAATGNVFSAVMDNAVAMTAIKVTGAGVRTQPFIELIGTQTGTADMIDLSADGAFTGDVIAIDMNAAVGANALFIDAGAATRTAPLILTTFDGDGTTAGGTLWDINVTNTGAASTALFDIDVTGVYTGPIFDVALGAAATGAIINVDLNLGLAAPFAVIDCGNGTRTADLFDITFDGDGNVSIFDVAVTNTGSGNLFDIDIDGIHAGNILDITYATAASTGNALSVTMGTNVAGSALVISGTGARTDDLIKIDSDNTDSGLVFDINMSGAGSGNVLDITYSAAANTGNAISVTTGTNLAGNALLVTTAGVRTAPVINVVGGGTDAGTDDHIFFVTQSAILDSNIIQLTYDTAASTGDAVSIAMGTNVAGMAVNISSAATGVNNEGCALNVAHTGALVQGGTVVRIDTTSNFANADGNVVEIIQRTGAGQVGNYGLYISTTGANVEALKVDDGAVVFDEALTVGGALAQNGLATFKIGYQATSVARTATVDGTGDAVIASGTRVVIPTSDNADKWLTLPTPVLGHRILILPDAGATGFEVRAADPANQKINNVSGANVELAVAATDTVEFICTVGGATGSWIAYKYDNLGAPATAGVAGA